MDGAVAESPGALDSEVSFVRANGVTSAAHDAPCFATLANGEHGTMDEAGCERLLAESPRSVGSRRFSRDGKAGGHRRRHSKRTERLLVTGEPRDLAKMIHDAQKVLGERLSAKKRADRDLKKLMKKIEGSRKETKQRVFRLGKEFLALGEEEYGKEKQGLLRITDELLELRQFHTRLCTLFLFAISPYTRRAFAMDNDGQEDEDLEEEPLVFKGLTKSSDEVENLFSVESETKRQFGKTQLAWNESGTEDEAEIVNNFQERLTAFQKKLKKNKRETSGKREIESPSEVTPHKIGPGDMVEYASSPVLSPTISTLSATPWSPSGKGKNLLKSCKEKRTRKPKIRCRICERMVDKDLAKEHFEYCLHEYKDVYQEYRLESLINSVKQVYQNADEKKALMLEQILDGLDLVAAARKLELNSEFSFAMGMEAAEKLHLAQNVFSEVLETIRNDHSHAEIKALAIEALDISLLNDASRELSPASSSPATPPPSSKVTGHKGPHGSLSININSPATRPPRFGGMKHPGVKDFDFLKIISRGSVGRVFLAVKRRTGDIYAIKVMNKEEVVRKNLVARILAERNVLARASCPFVVKFFFSFETRTQLFLAMEFVQGGDILGLLNTYGVFPEGVARKYASEIVVALRYLHDELHVCHRDLKPDNILIDRNGHVKLTDFGLSHVGIVEGLDTKGLHIHSHSFVLHNDVSSPNPTHRHSPLKRHSSSGSFSNSGQQHSEETYHHHHHHHHHGQPLKHRNVESIRRRASTASSATSGNSDSSGYRSLNDESASPAGRKLSDLSRRRLLRSQVGTPDYMAPEILLGIGHDYACDWWSLGIILYEMLFGLPPFTDETPQKIFNNILSSRFPTEDERLPTTVSEITWDLIYNLLQTKPVDRLGYHGAKEVESHPFFHGVDWKRLETGKFTDGQSSPFVPQLSSAMDTSYFRSAEGDDYLSYQPPQGANAKSKGDEETVSGLLKSTSSILDMVSEDESDDHASDNDKHSAHLAEYASAANRFTKEFGEDSYIIDDEAADLPGALSRDCESNQFGSFPSIDFALSQLNNLQGLNLAAAEEKYADQRLQTQRKK